MYESHGSDARLALLLIIPPMISIIAIYMGPDLEERRLIRSLNKAKLKKELKSLRIET
jgi:hypothetical protein